MNTCTLQTHTRYSKCVFVALGLHHAMRMRHFVISSLFGCTVFFQLSHKWHEFQGKNIEVSKIKSYMYMGLQVQ
jgi:hypothetical protein